MSTASASVILQLLGGLLESLKLAIVVLTLGSLGGLLLGGFGALGGRPGRYVVNVLLYFVRGIPLLIHAFAVFYVLPLFGLRLPPFTSAALALSIFASVTISEIIRGGIVSVPSSQVEAALALGFTRLKAFLLVVLPQALRFVVPPMVGQFVSLIKATSIISLLGVSELMYSGREIIERTLQGFEVMTLIWLLYTAVCLPLSAWGRWLERRLLVAGSAPIRG
ncbi:MAG TPA: amino acid ABC transporter permease [Stellaceae bacterium]|nr:amino acid ABC transporter permease [Stellaceae bacterium]